MERALADALSLEHPDVPWSVPSRLPTVAELQIAMRILSVAPVEPKHAAWCLAKLMLAFGTRLDAEATKLQGAVWIEACGDLGNDLWSKATLALIRSWRRDDHYGRAPEPSDFRAIVQADLDARANKLARCKAMLVALGKSDAPAAAKPFEREPQGVRLRTMIGSLRKIGRDDRAAPYERELATHEKREPEAWALNPATPKAAERVADSPVHRTLSPASAAALKRSLARQHRQQGRGDYADHLEREADAIDPEMRMEPVAA